MMIDCHCHAGTGDRMLGPWDTRADLGAYLRRCDQAGIERSVIFAALQSDYTQGNAQVAQLVRESAGRLMGFIFLDARMSPEVMRDQVRQHVYGAGMQGIKVHKHDAPLTRSICELAQAHHLPILYDVAGDVATIELFALEYRRVNFIIPHLGSFADDWKAQLALIDHLQRHPNVYADTSGVRRYDLLVQAVKRAGASKILFGSDGPWLHPGLELEKIKLLGLPKEDERLIAGGNLMRLLHAGQQARRQQASSMGPSRFAQLDRALGDAQALGSSPDMIGF